MRNLRGLMFRHGIMAKDKILYHKYLILKSIPAYGKNSNRVLCAIISSKMSNFCVQIKGKDNFLGYVQLDNLHTIRLQDIPDDINLESLRKDKVSECMNKFRAFIKSFI